MSASAGREKDRTSLCSTLPVRRLRELRRGVSAALKKMSCGLLGVRFHEGDDVAMLPVFVGDLKCLRLLADSVEQMLFQVAAATVAVFLNEFGDVLARSSIVASRDLRFYIAGKRFGKRDVDRCCHTYLGWHFAAETSSGDERESRRRCCKFGRRLSRDLCGNAGRGDIASCGGRWAEAGGE